MYGLFHSLQIKLALLASIKTHLLAFLCLLLNINEYFFSLPIYVEVYLFNRKINILFHLKLCNKL